MVWTHSGLIVHKEGNNVEIYASEHDELSMFADEKGKILDCWKEDAEETIKEDGWYQVNVGYDGYPPFLDPKWYFAIKIAESGWRIRKE